MSRDLANCLTKYKSTILCVLYVPRLFASLPEVTTGNVQKDRIFLKRSSQPLLTNNHILYQREHKTGNWYWKPLFIDHGLICYSSEHKQSKSAIPNLIYWTSLLFWDKLRTAERVIFGQRRLKLNINHVSVCNQNWQVNLQF